MYTITANFKGKAIANSDKTEVIVHERSTMQAMKDCVLCLFEDYEKSKYWKITSILIESDE